MRKIKLYSSLGVSGTIETNVRTLGELKPLLREREIDSSGLAFLVGETKNELTMDDSVLPEGDFKLYLLPKKTKSGNSYNFERLADLFRDIAEIFDELSESGCTSTAVAAAKVDERLSAEDKEAIAEVRRMSGQSSSSDDWS